MEHPLSMSYGPLPGWVLLLVLGGISGGFFLYQVVKATRLVMVGAPDDRFDNWGARIKEVITGWLGQKRVLQDKIAGGIHVLMFWGFLMLSTDMFDLATANYFSHHILPDLVRGPWNLIVETGYTIALIGCMAALLRRIVFTPEKLKGKSQLEGNVILLLIMTITVTSFFVEAGEAGVSATWEPIGYWVAESISPSTVLVVASYWMHMLAISTFMFLIPLSKHMHLVMAFPNVFFHDMRPMATMEPLARGEDGKAVLLDDLDIESFGTVNYTDLTWRNLIDGWACTSCARCQDVCPAYASGKALNPMQIIHDVRHYANDNSTALMAGETPEQDIIARFGEDAIWACTTCHACVEACPIYIDHVPKLTDARRHLMMERMEFDESVEDTIMPLMATIENLESDSNPYGLPAHERGDWADGLDVKVAEPAEYIYFAGCAASFDERNKKVARDTISVMKEAGLDVGILGMQEGCSGDSARRAGNEYLFQMLAETNLATFEEIGVKKIVASCPHCFHTLGKEYKDYGGEDIEVMHHSQLINHLQQEGKLPDPKHDPSVTFHDPCYLGRIGGELDAPRNAIGGVDVEIERHGKQSFCCGAGGAQMWMEEDADQRVNVIRAKEIAETGAETVAVGCPFCSTMVSDGLTAIDSEMEVKDIAEIVWEQIKANDAAIEAKKAAAAEAEA
ncbi:MAG TPA: (Fe-S)-binding protein [Candidatus Poseidoniales archaeon]|nr:(Fe-S)-binding protein [Candidatus Poseidoniaceae archaeon]MDP6361939.1 (Fe-S)-binding protein [Candidatus Poseidoniaceae archaeon]DAC44390.1 MAG TPA: (Fe-S)-binding protein [Candidatus Poseidoniales archaeon]HII22316.1 (Fe-S)-binding protein [Candidatus Poseidoniaceae archaeon]|tara:strand:+ start:2274 stop:4310 length:2037 start_codon:yes stop_codon:yes gene_type:complete